MTMNTQQKERKERNEWEQAVGLSHVFDQIRLESPPPAAVEAFMAKASSLDKQFPPREPAVYSASKVSNSAWRFSIMRVSAAVAATLLVLATISFVLSSPRSAWAQVVSEATRHAWVRLTLVRPANLPEDESFESATIWFNGERTVAAIDASSQRAWVDLEQGDQFEVSKDQQSIVLSKLAGYERRAIQPFVEALMPFDINLGSRNARLANKPALQTETMIDGKAYIDFTFSVANENGQDRAQTVTVRVDKGTNKPIELRNDHATLAIDYPESGPTNIYALGVSQDIPLHDVRSMEKLFEDRRSLAHADYEATEFMVIARLDGRWINEASRYYCENGVLRYERASFEEIHELANSTYFKEGGVPTGARHDPQWWFSQVNKLSFASAEWSESNYPHARCYGGIGSARMYECVVPSDIPGLEGTLELHGKERSVWLDPKRNGIVRRWEFVNADGTISVSQYDQVIQDSLGHWFVTEWRSGRVAQRGDPLPEPAQTEAGGSTLVHRAEIRFQ